MKRKILAAVGLCFLLTGCKIETGNVESGIPEDFVLNDYIDGPVVLKTSDNGTTYERYLNGYDDILTIENENGSVILYNDNTFNTYVNINGQKYFTDSTIQPKGAVDNIDIHLNTPYAIKGMSKENVYTKNAIQRYDFCLEEGKVYEIIDDGNVISVEPSQEIKYIFDETEYEYLSPSSLIVKISEVID